MTGVICTCTKGRNTCGRSKAISHSFDLSFIRDLQICMMYDGAVCGLGPVGFGDILVISYYSLVCEVLKYYEQISTKSSIGFILQQLQPALRQYGEPGTRSRASHQIGCPITETLILRNLTTLHPFIPRAKKVQQF